MTALFPEQLAQRVSTWSPLIYPGGKSYGRRRIVPRILARLGTDWRVVSPFLGGGSVELTLSAAGIRVYGSDVWEPLVEFWQTVLDSPAEVAAAAEIYYPMDKETFHALKEEFEYIASPVLRAAAFLAINRNSYSGLTFAGGFSLANQGSSQAWGRSWGERVFHKLRQFGSPNLSVSCKDYADALSDYPRMFAYLDPPYLLGKARSNLYGPSGRLHSEFEHEPLAEILRPRRRWLLSYNDCPEVRKLYAGHEIVSLDWHSGMHDRSKPKQTQEILIYSR